MKIIDSRPFKTSGLWLGLSLVPTAFLETLRWITAAPFSPGGLVGRWGLVMGVLLAAQFGALRQTGRGRWLWSWRGVAILCAAAISVLGYIWSQAAGLAWLTLGGLYVLLLILAEGTWGLTALIRRHWLRLPARLTVVGTAAAVGGLMPVVIGQIESHFADEEFFVLVQALVLGLFSGLVLVIHLWLSVRQRVLPDARSFCGPRLDSRVVLIGLILLGIAVVWATGGSYQASFYPSEAPTFAGISVNEPFLRGKVAAPGGGHPDGEAVFRRLLARVEANPRKRPPEYGMLALGTNERRWAEDFRQAILKEAKENRFAGPAHSVKSIQYDAALRLYYLWKVQGLFPSLFSEADKIVFRDGWSADSAYLLLNLRFTGWHRYKATNTLTLLYQEGPLLVERTLGQPFGWLPKGRGLFRDKRIPRENLNGLLVERTGMSAVLYGLTGMGGPWAQDPPFYAEVIAFETGDELDWSHTQLTEWHGWQHDRRIYFYRSGGPIVVIDEARGPSTKQAALVWHLVAERKEFQRRRLWLREGGNPAEVMLLPVEGENNDLIIEHPGDSDVRVTCCKAPGSDSLHVATVFLIGRWAGAEVEWDLGKQNLFISQEDERILLPVRLRK